MWIVLWKKPVCWSERNNANYKERKIVDIALLLVKGYVKLEKVWIKLTRVLVCMFFLYEEASGFSGFKKPACSHTSLGA